MLVNNKIPNIVLSKKPVWVTSDTHYHHANICKATSNWEEEKIDKNHSGYRDFHTLEEMDISIVESINSHVGEDDILIHLGDFSFGGEEYVNEFRDRIICKNVVLCLGNHDHHIRRNKKYQDLFLNVSDNLEFGIQRTKSSKTEKFFCSHYSHRVWNKAHHGTYHIFGHSHGGLDEVHTGKSMDVGVDCAFKRYGEYRPFNILEVLSILEAKDSLYLDHHK